MARASENDCFPTTAKFSEFVYVSQLERCVPKLRSEARRCILLRGMDVNSYLNQLEGVDNALHQLLTEFGDVVESCRQGGVDQTIVIFDLPEVLVALSKRNLPKSHQKIMIDTLTSELREYHSASELCMLLVADEQKMSVWRITAAYTKCEEDIKFHSHSNTRKREFLERVIKADPKMNWYCLVDPESAWIEEALKMSGLEFTVQMMGEPHRDPLKNAALKYNRFSTSKIYLEVKALESYFTLLDEGLGTVAKGCIEMTESLNQNWIKGWLVIENSTIIVIRLQEGSNDKALVVTRIGEALPVQYQRYVVKSRTPILHWLKGRGTKAVTISRQTDQGLRLETECDGIGAILVAPHYPRVPHPDGD